MMPAKYAIGMHKHFRMIALSEHLRNHGYDPTVETHIQIPGIWEKLNTLYNLDVIDERENSLFDYEDGDEQCLDFKLPEEYEEPMFMKGKRSPSEAGSSPPRLDRSPSLPLVRKRKRGDTITQKNRASTVDDTDDARTSPVKSPTPKTVRTGRSAKRSLGKVKVESSSRAPSRAETTMDEDDGEEEGTEDGVEEDEAEEDGASPSPKAIKITKSRTDTTSRPQGPSRKSKRKR
jgi:MRG-binding protein